MIGDGEIMAPIVKILRGKGNIRASIISFNYRNKALCLFIRIKRNKIASSDGYQKEIKITTLILTCLCVNRWNTIIDPHDNIITIMKNEKKKNPRVYELSQFTAIDSRLMIKTDLTHAHKSILSYMMGILNYNEKFQATNKRLKAELNVSPSTASAAFLLFEERGWITIDYFEGDLRCITCTEVNIQTFNRYLGDIEEYENYVKESMAKKVKQRAPKQSKSTAEAERNCKETPEPIQVNPRIEPKSVASVEVKETIELPATIKESDLTELLVDRNIGLSIDEDEEFRREMELQFKRMEEAKAYTTNTFDAFEWLKSFDDIANHEYCDDTYHDLIDEVEKRFSYKGKATEEDYISYFKWSNYREPHTEPLGGLIYESFKRNKRNQYK